MRATEEYQRRKALYLEKKRKRDAMYKRIGIFNENDEMEILVVKKTDLVPEGAIELDEVGVT